MNHRKMSRVYSTVVATFFGLICGSASHAFAQNLLSNGSFEAGTYMLGTDGATPLGVGNTAITGWTVDNNTIAVIGTPNIYGVTPEDGNVLLDLQGYTDSSPYGGVSQSLTTIPGNQYDLTFWIGVLNDNNYSYAAGPAAVIASAGSTTQDFTNNFSGAGNQWEEFSLPFTATSDSTPISLTGLSTAGGGYIGLDNVSVVMAPEPASLSLLALAAPALLGRRRFRV